MADDVLDAGEVLEERAPAAESAPSASDDANVEGARGKALLAGARRPWPVGARTFFVVTGLVAAAIVSALLLKARSTRQEAEARRRESPAVTERVERRVPPLKLAAPAPPPVGAVQAPFQAPSGASTELPVPVAPSPKAELLQRRLSRGFGTTEGEGVTPAG